MLRTHFVDDPPVGTEHALNLAAANRHHFELVLKGLTEVELHAHRLRSANLHQAFFTGKYVVLPQ